MKIITISGLDGSGKSTQIQLLKNYLESQNKRVFYFHSVQFSIANKILSHCERSEAIPELKSEIAASPMAPHNDKQESVTKAGWFKIHLRKIALWIDLGRFRKLISRLKKEGYDYLVSDRYFYDSVVNIEYLHSCHCERSEAIPKLKSEIATVATLPRNDILNPDLAIYLQTSPEIIMQRERIPDQGLEYLQKKKEIYDKYAGIWKLKIVDGNRNKEEIFEEIIQKISNLPNSSNF
jgi:thymidylate kinase